MRKSILILMVLVLAVAPRSAGEEKKDACPHPKLEEVKVTDVSEFDAYMAAVKKEHEAEGKKNEDDLLKAEAALNKFLSDYPHSPAKVPVLERLGQVYELLGYADLKKPEKLPEVEHKLLDTSHRLSEIAPSSPNVVEMLEARFLILLQAIQERHAPEKERGEIRRLSEELREEADRLLKLEPRDVNALILRETAYESLARSFCREQQEPHECEKFLRDLLESSKRVLDRAPDSIRSLAYVSFIECGKACSDKLPEKLANPPDAIEKAQRGLQAEPHACRPELMSEEQFGKLKIQTAGAFEFVLGAVALEKRDLREGGKHLETAAALLEKAGEQAVEQGILAFLPSIDYVLAKTYMNCNLSNPPPEREADKTRPVDISCNVVDPNPDFPKGLWYAARAADRAARFRHDRPEETELNEFVHYWYDQYHCVIKHAFDEQSASDQRERGCDRWRHYGEYRCNYKPRDIGGLPGFPFPEIEGLQLGCGPDDWKGVLKLADASHPEFPQALLALKPAPTPAVWANHLYESKKLPDDWIPHCPTAGGQQPQSETRGSGESETMTLDDLQCIFVSGNEKVEDTIFSEITGASSKEACDAGAKPRAAAGNAHRTEKSPDKVPGKIHFYAKVVEVTPARLTVAATGEDICQLCRIPKSATGDRTNRDQGQSNPTPDRQICGLPLCPDGAADRDACKEVGKADEQPSIGVIDRTPPTADATISMKGEIPAEFLPKRGQMVDLDASLVSYTPYPYSLTLENGSYYACIPPEKSNNPRICEWCPDSHGETNCIRLPRAEKAKAEQKKKVKKHAAGKA